MKRTFSIRNLLAIVAVIAGGLGSMRIASDLLLNCEVTLLLLVLLSSLTGAILKKRAEWIGFTVFSWGYLFVMILGSEFSRNEEYELTQVAISALADKFHDSNLPEPSLPKVNEKFLSEYRKISLYLRGSPMNNDIVDESMLTPEEIKLVHHYEQTNRAREERVGTILKLNRNARCLGVVWTSILFGSIGTVLGGIIQAKPPVPATASSI